MMVILNQSAVSSHMQFPYAVELAVTDHGSNINTHSKSANIGKSRMKVQKLLRLLYPGKMTLYVVPTF